MTSALVLLSGGQDSTTCLYYAFEHYDEVVAVGFDYGQRHSIELERAQEIADWARVRYTVLEVPALRQMDSALTDLRRSIDASGGMVDEHMPQGLPTSFVPGRNITFFSLAAAYAATLGIKTLISGVCQTDYSGYPDCRREFVNAMEVALSSGLPSSCGPISIVTPLMDKTKAETVQMAADLGPECWTAIGKSVTCYHGKVPGCGTCPSCELRAAGFKEAGHTDPQFGRQL